MTTQSDRPIRIVVVGLGNMGLSHAKAYHQLPGFTIVGLCSRERHVETLRAAGLGSYRHEVNFEELLHDTKPDAVSINTWPDTHALYAKMSFEAGADVFLEKPIAPTVREAVEVVNAARRAGRQLVVGYILRHHPSWIRFIELARGLGKPLVMRMNLNQQSSGKAWELHKTLMKSTSPLVDCGVHYVDIMTQMTTADPVAVHGMAVRLTEDIAPSMYNYGHLQVLFADGSIGWYEAGWGPMISETAFFVKDVFGPRGSVSIVSERELGHQRSSDDLEGHVKAGLLKIHDSTLNRDGTFMRADRLITIDNEPDHDALCLLEQRFFLRVIHTREDLSKHWRDALLSMQVVEAADRSIREGGVIRIDQASIL